MKTNLIRIAQDIEALSRYNATPGEGLTRFSFTKEDRGAREYIKKEMEKAGLRVYEDGAGTIIGRLEGKNQDAPVIMLGSHFDSVKNGGNFDGNAGVVTALEISRVLKENKMELNHPVEFVAIVEEEGGRFGSGLFGSRAMAGKIPREQLDLLKDEDGVTIAKAMSDFGLDPDNILQAVREPGDIKAFLELHIEQGPVLEHEEKSIGIVQYIVGINQMEVVIEGRADHAGTTPMDMRRDALDAAAGVIYNISGFAGSLKDGTVATVGSITALPGAANIVPGKVKFTIDVRSKDEGSICKVIDFVKSRLEDARREKEVTYTIDSKLKVSPVEMNEEIIKLCYKNCEALGFSRMNMLSGAGHDAMVMSELTRVGLIFVPSKNGRSHCPEEWTDYEDLQRGIELMYHTLLDLGKEI
ncbi:MAG TPA: Zn-dependent hydrolase [Clostridiaceae bacterium]|nr:Zn-dependent hydrolase [Clostridiaceae bacterium]